MERIEDLTPPRGDRTVSCVEKGLPVHHERHARRQQKEPELDHQVRWLAWRQCAPRETTPSSLLSRIIIGGRSESVSLLSSRRGQSFSKTPPGRQCSPQVLCYEVRVPDLKYGLS